MAQWQRKHLPIRDTWVPSLGREDPLEEGTAAHSSPLAWRMPWTEEPGRLQFMGLQRAGHDLATEHTQSLDSCLIFLSFCFLVSQTEEIPDSQHGGGIKSSVKLCARGSGPPFPSDLGLALNTVFIASGFPQRGVNLLTFGR